MPEPSIEEIGILVARWAATEPLVRRVYLYGSRAKGHASPDSDIDLAILFRADSAVVAEQDGDMWQARHFTWSDHYPRWHRALSRLFTVTVHLESPNRGDRIVRPALKKCRIRLW